MKVAIVTGGASGIGLATAREFQKIGYEVYVLDRNYTAEFRCVLCDVTDEESIISAFEQVFSKAGRIDLLLNNAGFGISGAIEFTDVSAFRRQIDVNLGGTFICSKTAIPYLRKTKGRIINVSSMSAVFSIPFQAAYSASKVAVSSLTLALRNELKMFGISVTAVMPGDVKTGFTGEREKSQAGDEIYGGVIERSVAVMEKDEITGVSPEVIGKYIAKVAKKANPKPVYAIGFAYKFLALLGTLLPARTINNIVAILYVKKK